MTMSLQTALHNIQTYQELLPITRELRAGLSSRGYQYATSSMYQGTISMNAIAKKAMKIRQKMEQNANRFTSKERNAVTLLSKEVSRLYREDRTNCEQADTLTTIYRFVMSTIFLMNHQYKGGDLYEGARKDVTYPGELLKDLPESVYEKPIKLPK